MEKEKYYHVSGKYGIDYVMWLHEKLIADGECVIVDCSKKGRLKGYVKKHKMDCNVILSGEMLMDVYSSKYVIFYHETEDSFTDSYPGVYFFFAGVSDVTYVNSVLLKLTDGKYCLLENTLIPQIGGRGKMYVMSLYRKKVTGERFIYHFQTAERGIRDVVFSEIYGKCYGEKSRR